MKRNIFFIISLFVTNTCLGGFLTPTIRKLALSNLGVISSVFATSKEQELIDFIKHEQKRVEAFKDKSFKEVESIILSSLDKFKKNSVIIPFSETSNFNKNLDTNDQQKAFDCLKQKMIIPDEIKLYHIQNNCGAAMSYNAIDRVVYTSNDIFSQTPTISLYQYIHELFHAQQHQEKGLHQFIIKTPRTLLEHDADTKATEFIKCPLCLKVILAHYLKLPEQGQQYFKSLGNFNCHDFKKSLEKKSLNDLCCAHQTVKNPNIWSHLDTQEGRKKIENDDYGIGSIANRLL